TLTFYGFFRQDAAHGETRAWICRSISCALRGGEQVLQHLCDRLGVEPGGTTADGKLTLEFAECLGACEMAPCMLAGETLHGSLDHVAAARVAESLGCALRPLAATRGGHGGSSSSNGLPPHPTPPPAGTRD
ncbi:MAG TPA: NAD(P)H-dependent oxidoreductase subunit E, partial [Pirellulaceae bacterium]